MTKPLKPRTYARYFTGRGAVIVGGYIPDNVYIEVRSKTSRGAAIIPLPRAMAKKLVSGLQRYLKETKR